MLQPPTLGPVRPPGEPDSNKGAAAALRDRLSGSKRPAESDGDAQAEAKVPRSNERGEAGICCADLTHARALNLQLRNQVDIDYGCVYSASRSACDASFVSTLCCLVFVLFRLAQLLARFSVGLGRAMPSSLGGAKGYGCPPGNVNDSSEGNNPEKHAMDDEQQAEENKKAIEAFKEKMEENMKEKTDMFDTMIESEHKVRLGEPGWRMRYYAEKFGVPADKQEELIRDMVSALLAQI